MSLRDERKTKLDKLRKQAEAKLNRELSTKKEVLPEDTPRLLYELHTHQIELEIQNEELRLIQQELLEARDRYINLYDLAPVGYLTIGANGLILEINLTLVRMLGMERHLIIQKSLSTFIAESDQDVYYQFNALIRKTKKPQNCELRMSKYNCESAKRDTHETDRNEKTSFWVQIMSRPLLGDNGEIHTINLSINDVTEFKQARDKLKHLATYDQLTLLPNRYQMETELKLRINAAKRFNEKLAILFIDLDNFKIINDTMGHEYGDILLKIVANRLSSHLRDYDTVARFGGDEFVLLMPQIHDNVEVVAIAEKIISEFSNAFYLKERESFITTSIGISVFPDDGTTVGELLKNADAAMYRAKDAGRNRYCFFTQTMNDELRRHQLIISELRLSLAHQEFSLYYQPLLDSQSGSIKYCEALIRWFPGSGELMSPAEFIPIAEKSELISKIGEWVINEACRQRAEWKNKGLLDFRIDINLSGKQFIHNDIFSILKRALVKHHLAPSEIGIELTENVLIHAGENNLLNLRKLHEAGMQISIDDFGTGYSSLSYLRHFPVHNLKIDREFISGSSHNETDRSIMEAIVVIGHRLGLKVIAEGIETEEQHRLAQRIGCDLEQGFFFHKPMEADKLYTILTGM